MSKDDRVKEILERATPEPNTGCLIWEGSVNLQGYATIQRRKISSVPMLTHRFVYELSFGPIPEGLELDHLCRVRCCINPTHLEPVTHSENMKRSPLKPQRIATHCVHGHPFSGENLVLKKDRRACRECRRKSFRKWYEKQKGEANV